VGHEIDVTLADLVADVRALTPSEAAERVVPSAEEMRGQLANYRERLTASLGARVRHARTRLQNLAERRIFRRPHDALQELSRRVDELESRATRAVWRQLTRSKERTGALAAQLEGLSPLGVLSRGYSVTTRADDGVIVTDASQLKPGERILSRLARGQIISRVEQCSE
jgi:exodeoxyribonuclease VII large subunit